MASFAGPTRNDSAFFNPPDSHMAVGPSNVVVTVNSAIAWYDKNGNLQNLQSQNVFFRNSDSASPFFDARVVYDPFGGHFYAISVYRQNQQEKSQIFVAESNHKRSQPGMALWYTQYEADRQRRQLLGGLSNPLGGCVWSVHYRQLRSVRQQHIRR